MVSGFAKPMLKMVLVLLFHLFFVCSSGLTGAGQESVVLLKLYGNPEDQVFHASSRSALPVAVSVSVENLNEVSSSILMAETWLRNRVLAHYPATKITTIVVGDTVLCDKGQEHKLDLVLPSLKNFYHSLTRWGLEKEIKVSAAFSSNCLHPYSALYRDDLAKKVIKPLLEFLQSINSTYSVNSPPNFSPLYDDTASLVFYHSEAMEKLGFFELRSINVLVNSPKERKPVSRKLSFMESKFVEPFPARPTPLPEIAQSPLHSSVGYPAPANVAKSPRPPPSQIASPPSLSFPIAPEMPPVEHPATPPFGFAFPPCNPASTGAPAPETGVIQKLWCVAKPSVPAETLQPAMDYACGEGGAACEEIQPHGNCYNPDTIIAHASYAFNSFWQKNKRHGGTCSFGGTAMLINADPMVFFLVLLSNRIIPKNIGWLFESSVTLGRCCRFSSLSVCSQLDTVIEAAMEIVGMD
ncbi:Glucan endo-1,3-beta-glucosidase 1 [Morella rubra]|uniref:glucan endo-1,3-beta-D-glucosidase n=1 Tax=Morella rubra TaxID=262757 RepID=A0A6A1VQ51_9ROSI|nr:Glucan endo-1,3-beta-glucosidase 1 [Morella rubra]